jgi:DNA-directed RNA polymerase beta' subunit
MQRSVSDLLHAALRAPDITGELALVDGDALRVSTKPVTSPDTLVESTHAPVRGGLFCAEIFGGGETQPADPTQAPLDHPRATTFGHIDLGAPIVHPLLLAHARDDVAAYAGISRAALDELVEDPPRWPELVAALEQHPEGRTLLVSTVPVLPPYLRPMKRLDDGRWIMSDLIDLYRCVIVRAGRLRRQISFAADDADIAKTQAQLAHDVAALFDNEELAEPTRRGEHTLRSLRKMLLDVPTLRARLLYALGVAGA